MTPIPFTCANIPPKQTQPHTILQIQNQCILGLTPTRTFVIGLKKYKQAWPYFALKAEKARKKPILILLPNKYNIKKT